jgi:cytochrome c oxidase cbb3-type subunit 3
MTTSCGPLEYSRIAAPAKNLKMRTLKMFIRQICAVSLLACGTLAYAGQADQAANAEKQKTKEKSPADLIAEMMGGPKIDQAAVERGRKTFVPACGFCHGNDARGKSGPDLVRSTLVLHDKDGDAIGPVLRNGRPDRGMPAFASFTNDQIADVALFLHSRASDVTNRFAYKIGDLVTGDSHQGEAFFQAHCASCHSPGGDLAHVAGKYEASELQRRMLYPSPNLLAMFLGHAGAQPKPTIVTVHLASGETVSGTLDHLDEFDVTLHDSGGWYRSFSRENATVDVQDPRAGHSALLPKYTDDDMHNLLAYLETLK